jgi:hypothetical protein
VKPKPIANSTFFAKKVFPIFVAMFVVVYVVFGPPAPSYGAVLAGIAGIAIFAAWHWYFVLPLADEVLDCGDHLMVRRGAVQQRVLLSELSAASFDRRSGVMSLRFARPGPFDARIEFLPFWVLRIAPRSPHPLEDDLIRRIDAARRAP